MDSATILAMWESVQAKFHIMITDLEDEQLKLAIGPATVGYMVRHSAEVEYVYASWVFGEQKPEQVQYMTLKGPEHYKGDQDQLPSLIALLEHSNETIAKCIKQLQPDQWTDQVTTPRGTFTRLDAITQLIYHTGIHAGQIALIKKHG